MNAVSVLPTGRFTAGEGSQSVPHAPVKHGNQDIEERNFSGSLDGLIAVDLTRTDPKMPNRYLGAESAARLLEDQSTVPQRTKLFPAATAQ